MATQELSVCWDGGDKSPQKKQCFFPLLDTCLRSLLRDLRVQNQRIAKEEMKSFIVALCSAARHIHRNKILHRDLKPANILVRKRSSQPVAAEMGMRDGAVCSHSWTPLIADFGSSLNLGAAVDDRLPTRRYCTLQYSAPEVLLRGMSYSFPSDIWSIGLIFAEMEHLQVVLPIIGPCDSDLIQLDRVWQWCQANKLVHSGDPLAKDIRKELCSRLPWNKLQERLVTVKPPGSSYGTTFASLVQQCLQLEPTKRSDCSALLGFLHQVIF